MNKKNTKMKVVEYGNSYTIHEFLITGISFLFTRLFWKGAKLVRYPVFVHGKKNMVYKEGFNIGFRCRFDLLKKNTVTLKIGSNCDMGNYTHISALQEVVIGDNFICGDFVYIGDISHGLYSEMDREEQSAPDTCPKDRPIYTQSIIIGNNVWIGEHVSVLPGAVIGNGCIIGANSVVVGNIPDNTIAVGAPAHTIKRYNDIDRCWEKI